MHKWDHFVIILCRAERPTVIMYFFVRPRAKNPSELERFKPNISEIVVATISSIPADQSDCRTLHCACVKLLSRCLNTLAVGEVRCVAVLVPVPFVGLPFAGLP